MPWRRSDQIIDINIFLILFTAVNKLIVVAIHELPLLAWDEFLYLLNEELQYL